MCSFSFIYLFRLPFLNWEILVLSLFYCRALGSPVCQSCFGFPKETDHWQWFGLITTAEIAIIIIHSSSITNANEFRGIAFFIYLLLLVTVCKYNLFYLETNSTWWISSRVFILEREKTISKLFFSLLLNTHSPFFFLSLCYIWPGSMLISHEKFTCYFLLLLVQQTGHRAAFNWASKTQNYNNRNHYYHQPMRTLSDNRQPTWGAVKSEWSSWGWC